MSFRPFDLPAFSVCQTPGCDADVTSGGCDAEGRCDHCQAEDVICAEGDAFFAARAEADRAALEAEHAGETLKAAVRHDDRVASVESTRSRADARRNFHAATAAASRAEEALFRHAAVEQLLPPPPHGPVAWLVPAVGVTAEDAPRDMRATVAPPARRRGAA